MSSPDSRLPQHGALAPAPRGVIPRDLTLNVLLLYFFTGILANYATLWQVNNAILVVLVALVFLTKRFSLSPLLRMYGMLTLLSLFNHACIYADTGELPPGVRTMPVIFAAMLACRACAGPGLFERATVANTLPLAALIPLGGIHFSWGRFYNDYLNESIHGILPQFSFVVGICALMQKRVPPALLAALVASGVFMSVSAGRRYFVFVVLVIGVLLISRHMLSAKRIMIGAAVVAVMVGVLIPNMTVSQKRRYGGAFSWREHFRELALGRIEDKSSSTRRAFWGPTLQSVRHHWLGVGNANFPYVVDTYGNGQLRRVGHPHSGILDALITGGYPGALLYLAMLLYIARIGWNDNVMRLCLIWLFLQIFIETTLADKILWPLMAIAERELELSRSCPRIPSVRTMSSSGRTPLPANRPADQHQGRAAA